ncbi:MAG TPA: phosphatase PAP2 family protein [Clostridia bacterium]|nr:phosphatase PAP2 family protein [Clostridia bacterium]
MELLKFLESLRTPFFDAFFSLITHLGSENVFTVLGLVIIWCVNKKWGFRYFIIGLMGNAVNQLLKGIFLIARPWVVDESFTIVEAARAQATGYSFPSGHTQSVISVFGTVAVWAKKRWIYVVSAAAILLVAFSRMYLGVHTLLDVGVSLIAGVGVVALLVWLFEKCDGNRRAKIAIGLGSLLFVIALVLYLFLAPTREASVAQFDEDGKKAACTLLGTTLGFLLAWWVDDRYTHFEVKAVWWAQALKLLIGAGLILGVRVGLKPVLAAVFGESALVDALRYFLMALVGGTLWPMTFKFWSGLGRAKVEKNQNLPLT